MTDKSPQNLEWLKAVAAFQAEAPAIEKGQVNQYGKYKYADLVEYLRILKPLAAKHGLLVKQRTRVYKHGPDERLVNVLETKLVHVETGQYEESEILLPQVEHKGMSDEQAMGSSISYYRKYAWAMLAQTSHSEDPDALKPREPEAPMPEGEWSERELRDMYNWLETTRDYRKATMVVRRWVEELKEMDTDWSHDVLAELKRRFEARKKVIGPKRSGSASLKEKLDNKNTSQEHHEEQVRLLDGQ